MKPIPHFGISSLCCMALMMLAGASSVSAQTSVQQEPDTPALKETLDYINAHTIGCTGKLIDGRTLSFRCSTTVVIEIDALLTAGSSVGDQDRTHYLVMPDRLQLYCMQNVQCVRVIEPDGHVVSKTGTSFSADPLTRDNLGRAFNHYFHLLQKQNIPSNDPFGPK